MELRTVLLILLAVVVALAVVFYQYFYKNSKRNPLRISLAILRFVALFCGLLLLINPKFIKKELFIEKAQLFLLIDDSASMRQTASSAAIAEQVSQFHNVKSLKQRFDIQRYTFGTSLHATDAIQFDKKQTDIASALSSISGIRSNANSRVVVLFTDGNTTLGKDYEHLQLEDNTVIYPIIAGDTTAYEDIMIERVTTNPYVFLKNKFPLETTIAYRGDQSVSKMATISLNGTPIHRQRLALNAVKNSETFRITVKAETAGFKTLTVAVAPLENEQNTENNHKTAAIEVIDEKTRVAIITDFLHPDISALKKVIAANKRRTVQLLKPTTPIRTLEEADLLVLYQPNRSFKKVYDYIVRTNTSYLTITGPKTDWAFLNTAQQSFHKESQNQTETIRPVLNEAFSVFGLGDFTVKDFPPLDSDLGTITLKKEAQTLLYQQIRGVDLQTPLLTVFTEGKQREALLLGENIWKWRAQTYRQNQNFQAFDHCIGQLVTYLSGNASRSRLEVDFNRVFNYSDKAQIRASYFDKSYQFNPNANLYITLSGRDNTLSKKLPMRLQNTYYKVSLDDLKAGEYQFTVAVQGENLKRSGSFKILDFNPEAQQQPANYHKLKRLADRTGGQLYFPDAVAALQEKLLFADRYRPVQRSRENSVPLIDFLIVLGVLISALTLEWCIKKYNGLL